MHSQRRFTDTTYEGEKDHSQRPSGLGRLVCETDRSKLTFTGEFRRGMAEGHGVLRMMDGSVFAGQFFQGSIKGYGVYTAQSGTEIKGFFRNNDLITLQGAALFSDGTAGVPFHEGVFSEDSKFVCPEKCPDQLALAQDSAERAFNLERLFENEESESVTDAAADTDTVSLATTSNILELDELAQSLTESAAASILEVETVQVDNENLI